jgi:hypothetical protein
VTTTIDTISGENLHVGPHGHETVVISVRCPRFGRISHVRLTHEQVVTLAGALTGIVLEQAAGPRSLREEP